MIIGLYCLPIGFSSISGTVKVGLQLLQLLACNSHLLLALKFSMNQTKSTFVQLFIPLILCHFFCCV